MPNVTIPLTPTAATPAPLEGQAHADRFTAADALERLQSFLGNDAGTAAADDAREAVVDGLREVATAHRWVYLQTHGRFPTNQFYNTGTIAYVHEGGTYPRQLTLTDGVWPDWAIYGSVRVGQATYDVQRRVSDTVLILDAVINPGADVDAGTSFTIYRDSYTMPEDFIASDRALSEQTWGRMEFVRPVDWLGTIRCIEASADTPRFYTYLGDPRIPGRLCMKIYPFPSADRSVDFVYQRQPRRVRYFAYETGRVSIDLASPTTATVAGGQFAADMTGSVLRLSGNTKAPTRLAGSNPYVFEATIISVESTTSCTIDQAAAQSYTSAVYRISDPIDVDLGSMLLPFQRCAEKHLAVSRSDKRADNAYARYTDALILGREADARSYQGRSSSLEGTYRQRMIDMPRGPDIS